MEEQVNLRKTSPEEEHAQEVLRQRGWDGGFPIAVKWEGKATPDDLKKVNLLQTSGDDRCFWVKDAVSALYLVERGHALETSPLVLQKRVTFCGK